MQKKLLLVLFSIALFITTNIFAGTAVLLTPLGTDKVKLDILESKLLSTTGIDQVLINPNNIPSKITPVLVAGYGENKLLDTIAVERKIILKEFDLNTDGYVFSSKGNADYPVAAAFSFLGLYYALDELYNQSAGFGKFSVEDKIIRPALRWRGMTMYDNWDKAYMDSVLVWTLQNRMNRIELKDTDIDDFIFYKKFNKLNEYRNESDTTEPTWGDATLRSSKLIEDHRQWLESYIKRCHDYGIEVVMWHHEFVVLDDLCKAYPDMCEGDSILYGSKLFFDWLESKYDEFFQGPGKDIDGIVLTTVEGNVHLVDFGETLIFDVLDLARRKCNQYGKKLIFRTFGWDDPQETALANVANKLPDDIWMMHKHIPMDWVDAFPHNPNLQRVRGKTSLLETELADEQRGVSMLPVWVGWYFQYRLKNALPTGILGVQGRINHRKQRMQTLYYGGSFNPNIADLDVFAHLLWNPEADVDKLYLDWAEKYYGRDAAPLVVEAFKPMQEAMMHMMLARGQFVNLRFVMDYQQWRDVIHWGNNLSDFDKSHPVQFRLKLLEQPDDRFFEEFLPEKEDAIGKTTESLGLVWQARPYIPLNEWLALETYFRRMQNLAYFCHYQMEAYGWLYNKDGLTEHSRERLKLCRTVMKEKAENVKQWDPDYMDSSQRVNIEMYSNMMKCIDEIDTALRK